jgi:hypothetical protein
MIPRAAVDEIQRLLTEGRLSQRKIARKVGVSRGTVGAIARQERPFDRAGQPEPEENARAAGAPPARCGTCGGMVRMPCLACRVRAIRGGRHGGSIC